MDRELPSSHLRRRRVAALSKALAGTVAGGMLLVWLTGMLKPTLARTRMRTALVERGSLEAVLTASGTVQPAGEEVISSPIEARIVEVLHRPGAMVEAGEALLELDAGQPRLDLQRLDEKVRQTEERRRRLELDLQGELDELRRRRVRLGLSGYRDFEVIEGLDEGDEVVISDVERLIHLAEVEIH